MESFPIKKRKRRIMKTNIRCFWYVYILCIYIKIFNSFYETKFLIILIISFFFFFLFCFVRQTLYLSTNEVSTLYCQLNITWAIFWKFENVCYIEILKSKCSLAKLRLSTYLFRTRLLILHLSPVKIRALLSESSHIIKFWNIVIIVRNIPPVIYF